MAMLTASPTSPNRETAAPLEAYFNKERDIPADAPEQEGKLMLSIALVRVLVTAGATATLFTAFDGE